MRLDDEAAARLEALYTFIDDFRQPGMPYVLDRDALRRLARSHVVRLCLQEMHRAVPPCGRASPGRDEGAGTMAEQYDTLDTDDDDDADENTVTPLGKVLSITRVPVEEGSVYEKEGRTEDLYAIVDERGNVWTLAETAEEAESLRADRQATIAARVWPQPMSPDDGPPSARPCAVR